MAAVVWLAACAGATARAQAPDPFEVQEIAVEGRAAAAELAELDGDGRADLLVLAIAGLPPEERRELQVHFQDDGRLPEAPSWRAPLPPGVAAYDLAELDARAGTEIVLLRADRLAALSLAGRDASWRELACPGPTAAPAADERGVDRLRIARPELGAARLLVPGLGVAWVLDASGALLGALRTGARANYFFPPRPGPLIGENEMELYFDLPRFGTADVDGDGRADVVGGSRHEVRVFLQRPDGRFASEPDRALPLRLLTPDDHVRNQGGARVDARDWDGDGRADLLVSQSSGGLLRAVTRTRLHRNRDGRWDLTRPDQVFENEGGVTIDELVDLDTDGRPELLRVFLPLGLIDLAEILLQRSVDVRASIHRGVAEGSFEATPFFRREFAVGFSFETNRPLGFVPSVGADWNGDRHLDLLGSGDGKALELWLGGPRFAFAQRHARQALDTGGRARFGDLDGDGLPDLVLYDPRRSHVPVRVARNRGILPR
jgi:hypothetical protein